MDFIIDSAALTALSAVLFIILLIFLLFPDLPLIVIATAPIRRIVPAPQMRDVVLLFKTIHPFFNFILDLPKKSILNI